ncbi:MAG: hypothetical protein FJW68_02120 [Actinobacteria bacterium]|nr:hypothetical protein [Actinomycetota bacterium]
MQTPEVIDKIINLLKKSGPLRGKEIIDNVGQDALLIWRICNISPGIIVKIIGNKYLRLDKRVDGFARLSPSIMREFLTYTVAGLKTDYLQVNKKAEALADKIMIISKDKLELSKELISRIVNSQKYRRQIMERAAFILAGDIVYNMAHAELRPEPSTGEIVRGSDLDIIIITSGLDDGIISKLDNSIYEEKYYLLKNPAYREEIDYIIKDIQRVAEQLNFDTFEHMVASKILDEGIFVFGSIDLFNKLKDMMAKQKITEKLKKLEEIAFARRKDAWGYLLNNEGTLDQEEYKNLFYTKEETEEIY